MSNPALSKWVDDLARKHKFVPDPTQSNGLSSAKSGAASAAKSGGAPAANTGGAPTTKSGGAPSSKGGGAPASGSKPSGGPAKSGGSGPGGTSAPTGGGSPAAPTAPSGGGAPTTAPGTAPAPDAGGAPTAAAGSGAKAQADAADAAAKQAEAIAAPLKALAAEIQKAAQEAQKHKQEATAAQTAATKAATITAPPKVPPPQGADAKARYDSSIGISGNMRKAQEEAKLKVGDSHGQETVAETAAVNAAAKAQDAEQKVAQAKSQAEKAKQQATAAATAATQAGASAATSKGASDKAAKDDANKGALQKTAQEDAGHATRAKAASAKAASAAKAAEAAAASADAQSKLAQTAKTDARSTADAVKQGGTTLDAKLAPFAQAVTQAEAQEADCKSKLSEDDAKAVLEKRYQALGGDAELKKAMAAVDTEFQKKVEEFRASAKAWQKERKKELDDEKVKLEAVTKGGEELVPKTTAWLDREKPIAEKARARVNGLGDKLKTELGKEAANGVTEQEARIAEYKTVNDFNVKRVELTKDMLKTLVERNKDIDQTYEAAEKFVNTVGTELDNELEMKAMTLEQKVDYLQTRPNPVRTRIQKQLDEHLKQILARTIAATNADTPTFEAKPPEFNPTPIDWTPIDAKIIKVEGTPLEDLKKDDPSLEPIRKEYEAAGGDKALFDKRVAAWKKETESREQLSKTQSDAQLSDRGRIQAQIDEAAREIEKSQKFLNTTATELGEDHTKKEALLKKQEEGTLTPQEKAELQVVDRRIKQNVQAFNARQEMIALQQKAKTDAEKLRDESKKRFEHQADDDSRPMPKKPESAEIQALPLKAKYAELTGKAAPA